MKPRLLEGSPSVNVQFDVPATMRDGVTLRANVYRPADNGPWPTLLTRMPYNKDDPYMLSPWLDPVHAARAGFMVIVQDTRGSGASDGEWVPLYFEREDSYDSVEWAARLPGSDGRVGMYGCSYFGNTQWAAAIEQAPSLAAIAPGLTWADPLDGLLARGGAVELGLGLTWTLQMGPGYLARLAISDSERRHRVAALLDDLDRLAVDGHWNLPISDMAVLRRHPVPDLGTFRMLRNAEITDRCRVTGEHERVTVPSLNIGGWYDVFIQGTLDNHMAMTALGRTSRLVVGPWSHQETLSDPIGEVSFGSRASGRYAPGDEIAALQLDWFRDQLQPRCTPQIEPEAAPVRIFVMGRNQWRDEDAWPPERARQQKWFLAPGGSLRADRPADGGDPTTFVYDPARPVPTVGGQIVMEPGFPPGAFDQTRIESRPDVCVFTSEPLDQGLEVTGRVRVALHVESSACSTDWVARLCDLHTDGASFNVCDGITRVNRGANACQRIEIDLWSTSVVFLAGHRLRVHVTSSSFPRWDRNLNTGHQHEPRIAVAHQRIYHDARRPSWIELPVIR